MNPQTIEITAAMVLKAKEMHDQSTAAVSSGGQNYTGYTDPLNFFKGYLCELVFRKFLIQQGLGKDYTHILPDAQSRQHSPDFKHVTDPALTFEVKKEFDGSFLYPVAMEKRHGFSANFYVPVRLDIPEPPSKVIFDARQQAAGAVMGKGKIFGYFTRKQIEKAPVKMFKMNNHTLDVYAASDIMLLLHGQKQLFNGK